jgi:hypothetical protein
MMCVYVHVCLYIYILKKYNLDKLILNKLIISIKVCIVCVWLQCSSKLCNMIKYLFYYLYLFFI